MHIGITHKLEKIDNYFFVNWFKNNGRNFPWRKEGVSEFQILITEILLKQTKATDVASRWREIIHRYSTPEQILNSKISDIKANIKKLGLASTRSKALKKISNELVKNYSSNVPSNYKDLKSLPYIGKYTANAILCFGFGYRRPIVDNNILRLLSRILGITLNQKDIRRNTWAWEAAEYLLPQENYVAHNYGMLDFTAKICTFYNPKCEKCKLNQLCSFGQNIIDSK